MSFSNNIALYLLSSGVKELKSIFDIAHIESPIFSQILFTTVDYLLIYGKAFVWASYLGLFIVLTTYLYNRELFKSINLYRF